MNDQDHIKHCLDQLVRFSLMFKTNTIDSAERPMQFGYNVGRLVVLCKKINQVHKNITPFDNYTIGMAKSVINNNLFDSDNNENQMINYGFAIGFLQETLEQSHEVWWKPIAPLCAQSKWTDVAEMTSNVLSQQNIPDEEVNAITVFDDDVIDWTNVHQSIIKARTIVGI